MTHPTTRQVFDNRSNTHSPRALGTGNLVTAASNRTGLGEQRKGMGRGMTRVLLSAHPSRREHNMARPFEVIHQQGTGTTLRGGTRITRTAKEGVPGIRTTLYQFEVSFPSLKAHRQEVVKDFEFLCRHAFADMAVRSSAWLLERCATEGEVHKKLGGKLIKKSSTRDGKLVEYFEGGVLSLDYDQLYMKREALPEDQKALRAIERASEEEQKMIFLTAMIKIGGMTEKQAMQAWDSRPKAQTNK